MHPRSSHGPALRRRCLLGLATALALAVMLNVPPAGAEAASSLPAEWVSIRTVGEHPPLKGDRVPSLGDLGYATLPVPPGRAAAEYIEELRATGLVSVAEPDVPVTAADTTPSDTLYADFQAPYLEPIGAERAWDVMTGRGEVVVAVLDTGIDLDHPELRARLWTNADEIAGNGIDDDGNGCVDDVHGCRFVNLTQERAEACGYTTSQPSGQVRDDHGTLGSRQHSHGTIVAGIIGALGDNGQGVAGISWNVQLMPVKVLDCGLPSQGGQPSGDLTNVAQGIDYARRMGADVINISLSTRDDFADLSALRAAVEAAQEDGVLIVAAAGNHDPGDSNVAPGYPAAYSAEAGFPLVVAVGAADNANGNSWAPYSNYGPAVDLAAPGNNIASTTRTDLVPGTGYGLAGQGTSYATPIVSGLFALMMDRNSSLAPEEYVEIAKAAATPPAPAPHGQNWAGAGVVDLGEALARVPLSVEGIALHDWMDVPPGSTVVGLVGGTECGRALTDATLGSAFAMRVKAAGEVPGCGTPGATVDFLINGTKAADAIEWGGKNEDLVVSGLEISTVSPPPGPIVVEELGPGWNNIGNLGRAAPPPVALSYLPDDWEEVRAWRPAVAEAGDGAFQSFSRALPAYANDLALVAQYGAVWVLLDGPATVAVANPDPPPGRAISLKPGWNNFVYTGTSRRVDDALRDIDGLYEVVARFDNRTGKWLVYAPALPRFLNDFGGLMRLDVYWVYMKDSAVLTMR